MDKKKDFQDLQSELKESAHKIWLAGLGALAAAEEEGSKIFRTMVEKGEGYESRGRQEFEEAKHKVEDAAQDAKRQADSAWKRAEGRLDEAVTAALGRLGVPSRDEIATLTRRVEELTAVVERLRANVKTSKTPAATKPAKVTKPRKPVKAAQTAKPVKTARKTTKSKTTKKTKSTPSTSTSKTVN